MDIATEECVIRMSMTTLSIFRLIWKRRLVATLVVSLGPFSSGIGKGYSSPALASLQDSEDTVQINSQQASWIAGLSLLGALFGDIVGGLALSLGRQRVLSATALPFSAAWLLTIFADHVAMIYTTSFVGGFCSAIITLASQIYISEIASPSIRGALCSLIRIFSNVGLLFSFVLGAYLSWRYLAVVAACVPVLLFVFSLFIPESPAFLKFQGKDKEAEAASRILNGGASSEEDWKLISICEPPLKFLPSSKPCAAPQPAWKAPGRLRCSSFFQYRLLRPLAITCGLMFFQRFSGAFVLNYYAVTIFKNTFFKLNPHHVAIIQASVHLVASCLFGLLVDRVGRVPLLIVGHTLISIALSALGAYIYVEHHPLKEGSPTGTLDWIPLVCVLLFTLAYSLGIGPIALLLVGELYPVECRGIGGAIATAFGHACGFIVVKTFVDFENVFQLSGTFWMYAVVSLSGAFFVFFLVPETVGKSLEAIQEVIVPEDTLPKNMTSSTILTDEVTEETEVLAKEDETA
ncbi:unnamed protein product [Cyprideis torosa]|uniref:Uncharacterized protein n=1 Tax=Cyprideis torosa TaxID=163714 RepID=A0A7R8WB85_9CRUS|nr:unnamed protein product [Cyprideis torosa]CAG0890564.1 unnamed protein product [Cyprideis torosa]